MESLRKIIDEAKIDREAIRSLGHNIVEKPSVLDIESVKYFLSHFPKGGRAPAGLKKEKQTIDFMIKQMDLIDEYGKAGEDMAKTNIINSISWWDKDTIDRIVDGYFKSGKKKLTKLKHGNITYHNESAMAEKRFKKTADVITSLLKRFKGEHKKALRGELIVRFKSKSEMRSKAVYKSILDEIWILDSPKVSKLLDKELYGWLPYVIVHELGHRYEKFIGHPNWYDRNRFITTSYSKQEHVAGGGEDFAECFALSFFGSKKLRAKGHEEWGHKVDEFKKLFK